MSARTCGHSRLLAGVGAAIMLAVAISLLGCVPQGTSGHTVKAAPMIWEGPTTFDDPEGRFSLYVPTGWSATQQDGYGRVAQTQGQGEAYVLVGEGPDIQAIVAQGLQAVGFPLTVTRVDPVPERAMVVISYDTGDPARFAQAFCTRSRGKVYVLLLRGHRDSLGALGDAFQQILSGFVINKEAPAAVGNAAIGMP